MREEGSSTIYTGFPNPSRVESGRDRRLEGEKGRREFRASKRQIDGMPGFDAS